MSLRSAWLPKLLSSDQKNGFWPPTHSLSGANAIPSLFESGSVAGRSTKR